MKKTISILLAIVILAGILRIVGLSERPEGFTWDEAALGYNAYSLLQTGRDEHGDLFPVVFRSFGDYKPGLYIYFTVPFIQLFGLNEFSTRLPSAISGILLVIMVYILCRKLFGAWGIRIGFCAATLAAINPWLIHFSRGAWESNVFLFLITLGINLYLSKKYALTGLFFGLSLITYQSAKLLTPMLIILLIVLFKPKKLTKNLVVGILGITLFLLPLILGASTQSGRLKVFSLASYTRTTAEINKILTADGTTSPGLVYYLFHSEKLEMFKTFALHYLNNYSPKFLFTSGDWANLRHSTPFYGNFHHIEVVTIILGLYLLSKTNSKKKILFIISLLLLTPVPASLSRDLISAVRSLPLALPLTILSGMGLAFLLNKKILFFPTLALLIFGLVYFIDLYVFHAPFYTAQDWLYPYKQATKLVDVHHAEYDRVVFTSQFGQPYIFILFFGQIDPKLYQGKSVIEKNLYGDVDQVTSFSKYEFGPVYWPSRRGDKSTLFVGGEYELPEQDLNLENLIRIGDVNYPNGKPALRIVGLQ